MNILQTQDLRKIYGQGAAAVHALDGVNMQVASGEFVAIVGTSGSGKSTLLHMLGGLDRPTSGTVEVDGRRIFDLNDEELTIFRRRKIGFVFQSYNLVPTLNVYENIVLPIELDGRQVDEAYIEQIIETLGLSGKLESLPIPTIAADGIFGERTREAVEAFQRIFDLPVSGVVDFPTWYKISQIYVGVTRIAELN